MAGGARTLFCMLFRRLALNQTLLFRLAPISTHGHPDRYLHTPGPGHDNHDIGHHRGYPLEAPETRLWHGRKFCGRNKCFPLRFPTFPVTGYLCVNLVLIHFLVFARLCHRPSTHTDRIVHTLILLTSHSFPQSLATPVIAQIARNLGIRLVSVLTPPTAIVVL